MATAHPLLIDEELKAFLEGPVAVVVGTRDSRLAPEITRAWGPRVSEDGALVSLCVPLATSRKTLDNLDGNGAIAVVFALPSNYQAIQLKGRRATTAEPDERDLAAVDRHRAAFAEVNVPLGQTHHRIELFWRAEIETSPTLVKITFAPEQIFDQTPGPGAGRRL